MTKCLAFTTPNEYSKCVENYLCSFQMIKREIWNVLWYAVVKMSNINITLLNTRCLTHYHRQMTHLGAFNSCSCSHPISKLKFPFSSLNKSNIARMTFWNSWETFKKGNVTLTLSRTLGFRRAHASYVDGLFAPISSELKEGLSVRRTSRKL